MPFQLAEHREMLIQAAPGLNDTLDNLFQEASRILTPQGQKDWIEGAQGLINLGKGPDLLITYLENMPRVAKEAGEDVIQESVHAVMKLASLVSGEVLTLVFATLPTVAQRLGDPALLLGYLQLLHRLASKAPRGLRPMLGVIDELLSKLTLSGLRRWVDFGAEAYRRDLPRQAHYFGLKSEDSRAVLQQERRGTLLIDTQRKLNFYLRAFWARDFFMRPAAADSQSFRPFIERRAMHLPDAVDALGELDGLSLYRAMAAHMAAHLTYSQALTPDPMLSPAQRFFIGFIEDARIEYLACQAFPGMRRLWRAFLCHPKSGTPEHEAVTWLEELAAALLDPEHPCSDASLNEFAQGFHSILPEQAQSADLARQQGLLLFDRLAQRQAVPSLRILEGLRLAYRDDNRFLWSEDPADWEDSLVYLPASQRQVRRQVGLMEFINEIDTETAGDDAQEIWVLGSELFPYEDEGISYNQMEGKEPVSEPFHYPEWDYQVQLFRPDWVTLTERRQGIADPQVIDQLLTAHKGISQRIRQIIDRLRPQGITRQRRLEDGDELDINAAVDAMVAARIGLNPDPRITFRNVINRRDLAVVVLLDLSESTNETLRGSERTVLELTRDAGALVATAIEGIGDPFAIHGFASDGRHDVHYYRFKDFNQAFDDEAKRRLAGMKGGLSTRMGAAMRHAAWHLHQRSEKHKLLLIVTDGEPADIDERDPQYLRMDVKKAVETLRTQGIQSYCLTLDPEADLYVKRLFGEGRYTVLDQVEQLPEQLPRLFASLTR